MLFRKNKSQAKPTTTNQGGLQPENHRAALRTYANLHEAPLPEMLVLEGMQNHMNGLPVRTDNLKGFRVDWYLHKRNDGSYLFVMQDAGTTGYTGRTYKSIEELHDLCDAPSLPPTDRLLRMNSMYNSGGNSGGGTQGWGGKNTNMLVSQEFHERIVHDTLRADDSKYLSFSHWFEGNRRLISVCPGNSLKAVRDEIDFQALPEIKTPGARVTICHPQQAIVDAMTNSFKPESSDAYASSFAHYIKTHFLVAIDAGAEICLHNEDGRTLLLTLNDFDRRVLQYVKDEESSYASVIETTDGKHRAYLRVSRLSEATLKHNKHRALGVSCYRAMQNMGEFGLMKGRWNDAVKDAVAGVITFDHDLEQLIIPFETPQHHAISFRPGPRQKDMKSEDRAYVAEIGREIARQLEIWQQKFEETSEDSGDNLDALNAQFSSILRQLNVTQNRRSLQRVEPFTVKLEKSTSMYRNGDVLPQLAVVVGNNTGIEQNVVLGIAVMQGSKVIQQWKWRHARKANPGFNTFRDIMPKGGYELSSANIEPGEFRVRVTLSVGNKTYPPNYTIMYFESGPIESSTAPVSLVCPDLAVVVEQGSQNVDDAIPAHYVEVISSHLAPLRVSLHSSIVHEKGRSGRKRSVITTQTQTFTLEPGETVTRLFQPTILSAELMEKVLDSPARPEERRCSVSLQVVLEEYDATLDATVGEVLASRAFPFYFGVEPPGDSFFVAIRMSYPKDNDPKRHTAFWAAHSEDERGQVLYVNASWGLAKRLITVFGEKSTEVNLYINHGYVREVLEINLRNGVFSPFAEALAPLMESEDVDMMLVHEKTKEILDRFQSTTEEMYLHQFAHANKTQKV